MSSQANRVAVRLERTIPAPPRDVYRAWLDPDLVRRWMAPDFEVTRVEIDARVGGHYRVWHAKSGSESGGFDAEILVLIPDRRIVFRWGFVGPDRRKGPVYDSTLTIELREAPDDATSLILIHERLDELAAGMPQAADKVEMGWAMVIEKLAIMLGAAKEKQDA
jgi:uncharacterized protein YndB with AHSA1/START domain